MFRRGEPEAGQNPGRGASGRAYWNKGSRSEFVLLSGSHSEYRSSQQRPTVPVVRLPLPPLIARRRCLCMQPQWPRLERRSKGKRLERRGSAVPRECPPTLTREKGPVRFWMTALVRPDGVLFLLTPLRFATVRGTCCGRNFGRRSSKKDRERHSRRVLHALPRSLRSSKQPSFTLRSLERERTSAANSLNVMGTHG